MTIPPLSFDLASPSTAISQATGAPINTTIFSGSFAVGKGANAPQTNSLPVNQTGATPPAINAPSMASLGNLFTINNIGMLFVVLFALGYAKKKGLV